MKEKTLTQKLKRAHMILVGLNLPLMANLMPIPSKDKQTDTKVLGQRYSPVDIRTDREIRNKAGELIKIIKRDPNSDISVIVERGADKRIQYKHIKMPLNYENGFYEIKEGVPITLKSKSK